MNKLCEELGSALKYANIEIPSHIVDNLSKELRVYQEIALKHYLLQRQKPQTNHLMFNMATGSGKTLMMASLILDCYQRGYRDFIFFVDKTTIVEKTKANFADKYSSKYLFKEQIIIDNSKIDINIIESLDESRDGCINILFTTVQTMFSMLKYERENAICLEDLKNKQLVFLADEAHHLNSDTKKKASVKEQEAKAGWEAVIQKAFESHPRNLMFEFSATIPREMNVLKKYQDKIVFEYDLAKFCKEGYSKRIFVMKYENNTLQDRFLGAILMSLFRELLAQDYQIFLKPVVLFKSSLKKTSEKNQEFFVNFLNNLSIEEIKDFYDNIDFNKSELLANSLVFFQKKFGDTYLEDISKRLKSNFKTTFILNTNDEKELEKNQILLNTLEDPSNDIRVIFTVDMLNEGWDVLNLFDIVRLDSKSISSKVMKKTTTKEVQLIGRGARYCPFESRNTELRFDPDFMFKRKFDTDCNNDLSILERLTYHTLNDVEFIKKLNEGMISQGLLPDDPKKRIDLVPNKRLKHILDDNQIYYAKNERIRKEELLDYKISTNKMTNEIKKLVVPHISKGIKESEENFEKIKEDDNSQNYDEIGNIIPSKYILKAMNMLGLSFQELNENFSFDSKEQFIKEFLNGITIRFSKQQEFNAQNCLAMAIYILENFKSIKQSIRREYEVTDFRTHRLNLGQRIIFIDEDETGERNYDWLFYNTFSKDSDLELEFLDFVEANKKNIDEKFSQWFIVRNDGFSEFKLYDNRNEMSSYGKGFEPDFIFFGKQKNEEKDFMSIECFIEAKGERGITEEQWKEEFLATINNTEHLVKMEDKLTLRSLPFFRCRNKDPESNAKFEDAFKSFIKE